MTEPDSVDTETNSTQRQQTPVLKGMLRSARIAQRFLSMYGVEHPHTQESIEALCQVVEDFLDSYNRATCVLSDDAVIVNDELYSASEDSRELSRRLRARGVMAITFAGMPSSDQLCKFLAFLIIEPRLVMQSGGPSEYLRSQGVTRIVATAAVYGGGDDEFEDQPLEEAGQQTDYAIGSALRWLSRHDDDLESERLPLMDILSRPDAAASLIHEAVTKLHASRRTDTPAEIATEVVSSLKELASEEHEKWDAVTPQVRKALCKLPKDMRPEIPGFISPTEETDVAGQKTRTIDIREAERLVHDAVAQWLDEGPNCGVTPCDLHSLFGTKSSGVLSEWTTDLGPSTVMLATGRTLATLMAWENKPSEHARVAHSLATLVVRAVELNDSTAAMVLAEFLLKESSLPSEVGWRGVNAKAALQLLNSEAVGEWVKDTIKTGNYAAKHVVCSLVEVVPSLALNLVRLLGAQGDEAFDASLRRGISKSGEAGLETLRNMLREVSPAAKAQALQMLAESGSPASARIIVEEMNRSDKDFHISALSVLHRMRLPLVVDACVHSLSHRDKDVRIAAIRALARLRSEAAAADIAKIAGKSSLNSANLEVQLAAIEALAEIGGEDELARLRKMSAHRPLLNRSHYDLLLPAARSAVDKIEARIAASKSEAA